VSAKADTWHEVPREGDFNRLNSYVTSKVTVTFHLNRVIPVNISVPQPRR